MTSHPGGHFWTTVHWNRGIRRDYLLVTDLLTGNKDLTAWGDTRIAVPTIASIIGNGYWLCGDRKLTKTISIHLYWSNLQIGAWRELLPNTKGRKQTRAYMCRTGIKKCRTQGLNVSCYIYNHANNVWRSNTATMRLYIILKPTYSHRNGTQSNWYVLVRQN